MQFSVTVAGVTKEDRERLIEWAKKKGIQTAYLVREADNKYDPNAIAVYVPHPLGRVKIGYIPNRSTCKQCDSSGKSHGFPSYQKPVRCPQCGNSDPDKIDPGTSDKIAKYLDGGCKSQVIIKGFTGGDESKGKPTVGILLDVNIDVPSGWKVG